MFPLIIMLVHCICVAQKVKNNLNIFPERQEISVQKKKKKAVGQPAYELSALIILKNKHLKREELP